MALEELLQGDLQLHTWLHRHVLLHDSTMACRFTSRALRLLGASELGQVPRGLSPLLAEVSKGSQLLQQVGSKLQPTVQHLLNIGMKPADVVRMLENPALRPRNAAELQR